MSALYMFPPSEEPTEDRDLLAGEYVLGVLDPGDAASARLRAEADPALQAAIGAWQTRLAPMAAMLEPAEVPPLLWERIAADMAAALTAAPRRAAGLPVAPQNLAASAVMVPALRAADPPLGHFPFLRRPLEPQPPAHQAGAVVPAVESEPVRELKAAKPSLPVVQMILPTPAASLPIPPPEPVVALPDPAPETVEPVVLAPAPAATEPEVVPVFQPPQQTSPLEFARGSFAQLLVLPPQAEPAPRYAVKSLSRLQNIGIWQIATGVCLTLAVVFGGLLLVPRGASLRSVAAIGPVSAPAPLFLAESDNTGRLSVIPLATIAVPSGRDLQLWTLRPGSSTSTRPVSLGVLPAMGTTIALGAIPAEGTQLLVTMEPRGGSPSGEITGPVLYGGVLANH